MTRICFDSVIIPGFVINRFVKLSAIALTRVQVVCALELTFFKWVCMAYVWLC